MSVRKPNKDLNTYSINNNHSGMFSSSQIRYYIETYKIIENYDETWSCLGSASYHMRIGGEILSWDGGKKTEYILGDMEDKNRNIFTNLELKPNSLTFVTTIEKFNLPKDIICRFNLKSKWVHQGLLLGTGPIVDPQLNAYLLIPLHNFSSQLIRMNFGDEILSVEFTKTLNPDEKLKLPDGSFSTYIENPNWDYDFKGYRKRIENKVIESSVLWHFNSIREDFKSYKESTEKSIKESEKVIEFYKRLNFYGFVGLFFSVIILVFTTWQLIMNAQEKADMAYNLLKQYKNQSVDYRAFALKSSIDDLKHDFQELKKYIERLNKESHINSSKVSVDIENLNRKINDRMTILEERTKETSN